METNKQIITFAGLFVAFGLTMFYIGVQAGKSERNCQHKVDKTPEIVWNDDFESFPSEGELIRVEKDCEDTIYIGPAN